MKLTFWSFFLDQWAHLDPPIQADLTGKNVIVTGANTGIGFETAKHFARMKPARLILACRSEARGREALERLARETGYAAELELLDLSSFSSVNNFASRLRDVPVDILVANAALATPAYEVTKDGWEQHLQVNHLSTALLSFLLMPNLVKAAEEHAFNARLVVVCSEVHHWAHFEKVISAPNILQRLNDEGYCVPENMMHRYPDTKLLNVFFTRAFAEHLPRSVPVIPSTVNPGFCVSELRRSLPALMKVRMKMMDIFMGRTAEHGSRQLIWAALGPDGKDGEHVRHLRGAYVSTLAVHEPSDFVISKEGYEVQERLWNETVDILKEVSPDFVQVFNQYFQK